MPSRSYGHYCSVARALDAIGDRWTLLIVRELLAGPRRYTDLHADLPGISTDVLAARLKDMERDGLATRRRLPPPGAAVVYELTAYGQELLPVLTALGNWGAPVLAERRPTDAVRAHWFALPLLDVLLRQADGRPGVVDVRLDEGVFHLRLDPAEGGHAYGDGPAGHADVTVALDTAACLAVVNGTQSLRAAVESGRARVIGEHPLAAAIRGAQRPAGTTTP